MVDNYDSFTFNLVHYLEQLDVEIIVRRNDELSPSEVDAIAPTHLVISPGPCDPDKAGQTLAIIQACYLQLPILGVCLGHQAIGQFFGGQVVKAKRVMHGKTSPIYHANEGVFSGIPQAFTATRYHSLVVDEVTLPDCLEITAWTQNASGTRQHIMGLKHRTLPIEGVQFHPESVLSEHGLQILSAFIAR